MREDATGLTDRSLGDLDDGPLRALVAAWGSSGRAGMGRANTPKRWKAELLRWEWGARRGEEGGKKCARRGEMRALLSEALSASADVRC